MAITHRPLETSDFPALLDLFRLIEREHPSGRPVNAERLRSAYFGPDPGWLRVCEVWHDGRRMVGFGTTFLPETQDDDTIAYARFRVHPDLRETTLPGDVLAWAEKSAARMLGRDGLIETTTFASDVWANGVLEQSGYTVDRRFHVMRRSLAVPVPPCVPPPGYLIRPLDPVTEVDAWAVLHSRSFRDHYDFHPVTAEARRHRMTESGFHPEFDMVAVAEDGSLAAFCVSTTEEAEDGSVGWHIDLVGTDPAHRRRGLAEALVLETLTRLQEMGVGSAELWVDATSPTGANRLYERLGFEIERVSLDYRKRVSSETRP